MTTSGSDVTAFRRALRRATPSLRRPLPWVGHDDPWAVLVSEFMLQQTQTSRVVEPWAAFLERFPTPTSCASAPLSDVLRLWEGLGYHRRAKALHDSARLIRDEFDGVVPSQVDQLRCLTGVGEYTANAVASFCFGARVAVLDTNVGRVLSRAIANRSLRPHEARDLASALLPRSDVARFNQAMLDLGAQYCTSTPRCETCPVSRQCRWHRDGGVDPSPGSAGVSRPQSVFDGSDRQGRGRIIATLRDRPATVTTLARRLDTTHAKVRLLLDGLAGEGLVEFDGRTAKLAGD